MNHNWMGKHRLPLMGRRQHNTLGPGECANTFREAQIVSCHCEIQAKSNLLARAGCHVWSIVLPPDTPANVKPY